MKNRIIMVLVIVAVFLLGSGTSQFWDLTSSKIETKTTVDLNLKGDLLLNANNTYDIGTASSSPRVVYGNKANITRVTANSIMWGDTSTSAAGTDSFVVAVDPVPSALATGMSLYFKPDTLNTGACVINVNSLGWKSIKTASGADPANSDLVTTTVSHIIYDGTNFLLMNPATTTD